MAVAEIPKCSICGHPMVPLKETEKKKMTVFVCSIGKGGGHMPCDGYAYKISQQQD